MRERIRAGSLLALMLIIGSCGLPAHGQDTTLDLRAIAKKASPAVMLLVTLDGQGGETAIGTGFLVSSDGKLVTNRHVIEGARGVIAKAHNGGIFPVAGLFAEDVKNDLVILGLQGKDLPFLSLGSDEKIDPGTRIAVIGSPLGLEGTLSEGIVSAVRDLPDLGQGMLQITAPISPGSSGSPVLNEKGEVVGVATAILREGQSLNFAVPVERVNGLLAKAQQAGKIGPLDANEGIPDKVRDITAYYDDPAYIASLKAEFQHNYAEMLKQTQILVQRHPDNDSAHERLGDAFRLLGFHEDAVSAYKAAIELSPDSSGAWKGLGDTYKEMGRPAEATDAYQQAVASVKEWQRRMKEEYHNTDRLSESGRWHELGDLYVRLERDAEAVDAFRQAVKILGDNLFCSSSLNDLGDVYMRMKQYRDAADAYQRAVKLWPGVAEGWNKLGCAYGLAGRHKDAIRAFQQVVKLQPDCAQGWHLLCLEYAADGQRDPACEAYKELQRLSPDDLAPKLKAAYPWLPFPEEASHRTFTLP